MIEVKDYLDGLENGRILGSRCKRCGNVMFPLKPVCSDCGSFDLNELQSKGKGVVRSFTVIYAAPIRLKDSAPYAVGLIRLEEGTSIMGRIIGIDPDHPDDIKAGTKVKFEPLKQGDEIVVAFRPQQ